jgi:hypothetical protein
MSVVIDIVSLIIFISTITKGATISANWVRALLYYNALLFLFKLIT